MGWATTYIAELQAGREVQFRPVGNSMQGVIESGDLVTVVPLKVPPVCGDAVLCNVNGKQYLHLVSDVQGNNFQISNNQNRVNGWIPLSNIFGVCTLVEAHAIKTGPRQRQR